MTQNVDCAVGRAKVSVAARLPASDIDVPPHNARAS